MPSLSKRQKEQQKRNLPDYNATEEEFKWYKHCLDNEIRISPIGTGEIGKWHIGISTPDDYRKVYKSPEICDKHSVWEVFYKYCKYYYEKE